MDYAEDCVYSADAADVAGAVDVVYWCDGVSVDYYNIVAMAIRPYHRCIDDILIVSYRNFAHGS
jgi:hypothetical protein